MSYFLSDRAGSPGKKQGKRCHGTHRVLSPSRVKRGMTRDEYIEGQADMMQGNATQDFLLKKLDKSEAKHRGKGINADMAEKAKADHVFGEPFIAPAPRQRLRENPEEMLEKIYRNPETKKEEAAAALQNNPTMIDKLMDCNYPRPRKEEKNCPGKRILGHNHPLNLAEPLSIPQGVDGFRGMAANSKQAPLTGRSCKPVVDTVVQMKPPVTSRREKERREIPEPITGQRNAPQVVVGKTSII